MNDKLQEIKARHTSRPDSPDYDDIAYLIAEVEKLRDNVDALMHLLDVIAQRSVMDYE